MYISGKIRSLSLSKLTRYGMYHFVVHVLFLMEFECALIRPDHYPFFACFLGCVHCAMAEDVTYWRDL